MAATFVPISSLPVLGTTPGIGMSLAIQAAGVTYQVDARQFPLRTDTLLTWQSQAADLPNSKMLTAGLGISIALGVSGVATISASPFAGGSVLFNSKVVAAIPTASENDFNPVGWAQGLDMSAMRLTPAAGGSTLTGIDATAMVDGQTVQLFNQSTVDTILLLNQSGLSAAGNRFFLPLNADFPVLPGQVVLFIKDTDSGSLRVIG